MDKTIENTGLPSCFMVYLIMKKEKMTATNNAETVTITRAEYEEFQAQRSVLSALEKQVERH